MDILHEKYDRLISYLKSLESVAVAFSAGVDSTFLLKAAREALGKNAIAITAKHASFPARESKDADEFCHLLGVEMISATVDQLAIEGFCSNPKDRCYICKKALFTTLLQLAHDNGFKYVAEGSNQDDLGDYRPGLRAIEELGIKSPLREAGLTKDDIRALSKELGLPTWNKPPFACLATRIPYGEEITEEKLRKIDASEQILFDLGFPQFRVRSHGDIARIEIEPSQFAKIIEPEVSAAIDSRLKDLGYKYVTLDLKGYRTGSMKAEVAVSVSIYLISPFMLPVRYPAILSSFMLPVRYPLRSRVTYL